MVSTKELRGGSNIAKGLQQAAINAHKQNKVNVPPELKKFYGYEEMLRYVLLNGVPKTDRTGTGTIGVHGYQLRFDLDNGFPLITTKKIFTKALIEELLWFIRGETNIRSLAKKGVRIWDDWPYVKYEHILKDRKETPLSMPEFVAKIVESEDFAKEWGDLGPVYGAQWRNWKSPEGIFIDQLDIAIQQLKKQHEKGTINRRVIVVAWNPADIGKMALPACHCFFQFHTQLMTLEERLSNYLQMIGKSAAYGEDLDDDYLDSVNAPIFKLDLQMYQRSCDIFLGVPFNIASYSLLLMMVARVTNMKAGTFIHDFGDLHLYSNHFDQVVLQLSRLPYVYPKMEIDLRDQGTIDDFIYEDFKLVGYESHPLIKASVAV
jgi:thymidylate synthase